MEHVSTSDDRHVMIVAHTEKFWRALAAAVARPGLVDDPRFSSNRERLKHRDALELELGRAFETDTLDHWSKRLTAAGVLFAPVRNFEEVFNDQWCGKEWFNRFGTQQQVRFPF